MKITFVSNYINHHQVPFCNALYKRLGGDFTFVQTMEMEQDRIALGWNEGLDLPYLKKFYKEKDFCKELIQESDVVIFGGCEDESYLAERLEENLKYKNKPVIRISERLYREGQWKAISPKGLIKKYHDHTRHNGAPVYLLCAGGYVAADFNIVRAYRGKRFKWGYFPPTRYYESVENLINNKGYFDKDGTNKVYILWVARFIPLKHPEYVVWLAKRLKEDKVDFHIDMVGVGPMEEEIGQMLKNNNLCENVALLGQLAPMKVRDVMEKADIFLFTSNKLEGWGAVVNEAMNSACAVVCDHLVGAAPFLIEENVSGLVYKDKDREDFYLKTKRLITDTNLRKNMGAEAYKRISGLWNAEVAAERFMCLATAINEKKDLPNYEEGPLSRAEVLWEGYKEKI